MFPVSFLGINIHTGRFTANTSTFFLPSSAIDSTAHRLSDASRGRFVSLAIQQSSRSSKNHLHYAERTDVMTPATTTVQKNYGDG